MNALVEFTAGLSTSDKVERLEGMLLPKDQVEIPLTHRFAPGVYLREVLMPAGTIVVGHAHNTEHFNIIIKGRATVMMDGVVQDIVAPQVLVSKPGVRKCLYIHEDMIWQTVHPTEETDLCILEDLLITKSETFLAHHDLKLLKEHVPEIGEIE